MSLNTVYKLINEFETAAVCKSWAGSMEPEQTELVKVRYTRLKKKLKVAVKELLPKHSLVSRAVEDML